MPAAGALIAGGTGRAGRIQNGRVNPAVGIKRTGIALFIAELQFPKDTPVGSIHVHQIAHFAGHKHAIPHQDGRTGRGANFIVPKFHRRTGHHHRRGRIDGSDVGNFERHHLPRLVGSAVNGDDFLVVLQEERRVDARLEKRNAEDRIAGAGVDADHRAISRGRVENPFAIQPGEDGMGVGIVLGPVTGVEVQTSSPVFLSKA